jgi:RNA polymerase-binding transcription factor DksA
MRPRASALTSVLHVERALRVVPAASPTSSLPGESMPAPVTHRPLSAADLDSVRTRLALRGLELDEQMASATAVLDVLSETSDVSDPGVQEPLMAALRSLDAAEHEASDVADALNRLADGRYGTCLRCSTNLPSALVLSDPLRRMCARCDR